LQEAALVYKVTATPLNIQLSLDNDTVENCGYD
jgi:hypothetical protein